LHPVLPRHAAACGRIDARERGAPAEPPPATVTHHPSLAPWQPIHVTEAAGRTAAGLIHVKDIGGACP